MGCWTGWPWPAERLGSAPHKTDTGVPHPGHFHTLRGIEALTRGCRGWGSMVCCKNSGAESAHVDAQGGHIDLFWQTLGSCVGIHYVPVLATTMVLYWHPLWSYIGNQTPWSCIGIHYGPVLAIKHHGPVLASTMVLYWQSNTMVLCWHPLCSCIGSHYGPVLAIKHHGPVLETSTQPKAVWGPSCKHWG